MGNLPSSAHNTLTTPEKEYHEKAQLLLQEVKERIEKKQVAIRINKNTVVTISSKKYSEAKRKEIINLFSGL